MAASFLLEDGSEPDSREVSAAMSAAGSDIPFDEQQERIRVEVLNGAGDAGAAARLLNKIWYWSFLASLFFWISLLYIK